MEETYCQSCGMPMGKTEELYGTEADGSISGDYCKHCYDKGEFTQDVTMEGMIEICLPFMGEMGMDMTEDQARAGMREFFPELKRWKEVQKE